MPPMVGYVPHARQKLNQTTIAESKTDDNAVDASEISGIQVQQAEDESGQGKSRETKRSWVGEFATLDRLVETGLEFTTESWKHAAFMSAHMSERPVAETSGMLSSGFFLVAHAASGLLELLLFVGSVAIGCQIGGVVKIGVLLVGRHGVGQTG